MNDTNFENLKFLFRNHVWHHDDMHNYYGLNNHDFRNLHDRDYRNLHDSDYRNLYDPDYRYFLSNHYANYSIQIFMEVCRSNINPKFLSDDIVYFPEFNLGMFDEKMRIKELLNIQKLFEKFFSGFRRISISDIIDDLMMFYVDPKCVEKNIMEHFVKNNII